MSEESIQDTNLSEIEEDVENGSDLTTGTTYTPQEFLKKLREESSPAVWWKDRSYSDIGQYMFIAALIGLFPSLYDSGTDSWLFHDFYFGKEYVHVVSSSELRSLSKNLTTTMEGMDGTGYNTINTVNNTELFFMSDCTLLGFYTDVNGINGTQEVSSYTFSCFEKDPHYSYLTMIFILLPGLFITTKLHFLKLNVTWTILITVCSLPFPIILIIVKTVVLFVPGENWHRLSKSFSQCEGVFESSFQLIFQLWIIFTRSDRQPSIQQYLSISASVLVQTGISIEAFIMFNTEKQTLKMKEKLWKAITLFPLALTSSGYKLITIALVCSMGHLWSVGLYVAIFVVYFAIFLRKADECIKEMIVENAFGLTCLPSTFSEEDQKKQLQFHNRFWLSVNLGLLCLCMLAARYFPDYNLFGYGNLQIVRDISKLNTIAIVTWSSGVVSYLLNHIHTETRMTKHTEE
jgi:hypothetical protein